MLESLRASLRENKREDEAQTVPIINSQAGVHILLTHTGDEDYC